MECSPTLLMLLWHTKKKNCLKTIDSVILRILIHTISTAYSYNNFSAVVVAADVLCSIFGTLICLQSSKTLWNVSFSCCTTGKNEANIKYVKKKNSLQDGRKRSHIKIKICSNNYIFQQQCNF